MGLQELLVQGIDIITLVLGTITPVAGQKDRCEEKGVHVERLEKRLF